MVTARFLGNCCCLEEPFLSGPHQVVQPCQHQSKQILNKIFVFENSMYHMMIIQVEIFPRRPSGVRQQCPPSTIQMAHGCAPPLAIIYSDQLCQHHHHRLILIAKRRQGNEDCFLQSSPANDLPGAEAEPGQMRVGGVLAKPPQSSRPGHL